MARSYRKPYTYWCVGRPTKDRRAGGRRHRRATNQWTRGLLSLVDPDDADPAPVRRTSDNPWDWTTDGTKSYAGPKANTHWDEDTQKRVERLCRK